MAEASEIGSVAINQVIIAEVAPQFASLEEFLKWLVPFDVQLLSLTDHAAFCGGTAFLRHRERRKTEQDQGKSILADFLIGGHAQTLGATILTRDPRFYRTYFPSVPLITPDKAE